MTVVSATSPLNYLVLIGLVDLLPELFEQVIIPESVRDELSHAKTPRIVKDWLASRPHWLSIEHVSVTFTDPSVHRGEAEVIQLAANGGMPAIIDDRLARTFATNNGLQVIGTTSVLYEAASRGFIDYSKALASLRTTSFHMSQAQYESLLSNGPRLPRSD